MSVLSFGVSFVIFVFSIIWNSYLCLDEVFQVFIEHSLKIMIFSNDFLNAPSFIVLRFLALHVLFDEVFTSLEEV
jgi:hypothetical protein